MNDETIKAQSYQETYEEKLERLPKVLEAYADDAEKSAFWKGDSGLTPALQSASDALKALYAEVQELRDKVKAQEWQPIETAPKDRNKNILVWHDPEGAYVSTFNIAMRNPNGRPLFWKPLDTPKQEQE